MKERFTGWAKAHAVILFGALCALAALFLRCEVCSDDWFMVDQAADMLENGLGRDTDFLSMHGWLPFQHQKWAMCLLVYGLYGLGGMAAMRTGMFLMLAMLVTAVYACLCRLYPGRLHAVPMLLFLACGLDSELVSLRPHLVSGACLAFELYALERHAQGRISTARLMLCCFLASMASMWFHSTMWHACLIPFLPYLAETKLLCRISPRIGPPAPGRMGALAGMLAAMAGALLNPEGPGIFRYLLLTAQAAGGDGYQWVNELQPFLSLVRRGVLGAKPLLWASGLAYPAFVLIRCRRIRQRDAFLVLGSILMPFLSFRLMFYSFLFLPFALAGMDQDGRAGNDAPRLMAGLATCTACCAVLAMNLATRPALFRSVGNTYAYSHGVAMAILENAEGGRDSMATLCTSPTAAQYMEHLGVPCYIDCRAELFQAKDQDGHSPAGDILGLMRGEWRGRELDDAAITEFLGYYGIRYVVVHGDVDEGKPGYIGMVLKRCTPLYKTSDDGLAVWRVEDGQPGT